jgi:hypothetical protein
MSNSAQPDKPAQGSTVPQDEKIDEPRGTKRSMSDMRAEAHENETRPARDVSRPIGKKVLRRSNGWDDDRTV